MLVKASQFAYAFFLYEYSEIICYKLDTHSTTTIDTFHNP